VRGAGFRAAFEALLASDDSTPGREVSKLPTTTASFAKEQS
jgi:hypothetical protein